MLKVLERTLKDPKKRLRVIFAAGVLGIILIFLSEIVPAGEESEIDPDISGDTISLEQAEQYKSGLEQQLTDLISEIKGVGNVKVMVTVNGSLEYVYAEKTGVSEESDSQGESYSKNSEITLAAADNDDSPVLKSISMPQIVGACVVCEGADDPLTKEMVLNAVSAALGIPTTRISVQPSGQ